MKRTHISLLLTIGLIIGTIPSIFAQPGTLDASFGGGGIVTTNIGAGTDKGFSVIQQPDDKLLVAGLSNNGTDNDFALIRYNIDGSLDPTFGAGGIVTTPIGLSNESGQCVILQPDDKIIVAGFTSTGSSNDFALVRYNPNGSLDNTFGIGGIVTTSIGAANDQCHSVVLQTNGKIVAAGFMDNGANTDFALTRYNSNGTLDVTFGTGGIVVTDIQGTNDVGRSVALQTDGKIVAGGWSFNGASLDMAVLRYDTTGTLDGTFDADGFATTSIGANDDQGYSLAIQADGKIILAGISNNGVDIDFASVRYNTNGSPDNTFDLDGIVTTDFAGANDYGYSVAIQTDAKILIAGQSLNVANNDFGLARYNPDGSLDLSFDTDGLVTTDLGSTGDVGWSVTIQGDGKTVVTGSASTSGYSFGTARYNVCGLADTTIFESGPTLFATAAGFSYQWLNCDSSNAVIPGATNQDYTPIHNGNYSVIITTSIGCADTSNCYSVSTFGIEDNVFAHSINVYPNPTNGIFNLVFENALNHGSASICNVNGQTIFRKNNINGSVVTFDITAQPNGIYFCELHDGINTAWIKIVKK